MAPIVRILAMNRLVPAVVVSVLAAVCGGSAADAQQAGTEAYGQVSSAVSQSFQRLIDAVVKVLPAVISAIIVLAVFWGLATVVRRIARAGAQYIDHRSVRLLVTQVPYYLVWMIGVIVTLDAAGVNLQAAVTALGLGSVAIGFALKDILSNLVSGILILAMHPFEIGDQIVIGDTEGTVEEIEFRATYIRTYDGRLVLVPNGEVFTSRITNNTASPLRRASVSVSLGYKENTGRALSTILDTVRSVPGVAATPPPSMRLKDLHPKYMQLEARFWTDSQRTNLMNAASAARAAILRALKEAGIQLPDPDERVLTSRSGSEMAENPDLPQGTPAAAVGST
jgi:small-conductance mechanosensitive channel